jgi:hypothetical protein
MVPARMPFGGGRSVGRVALVVWAVAIYAIYWFHYLRGQP